ncbi:glycosyltransferase family 2 protein [Pyrobaculum ferrireducens]|uniref:Glycosyltransferase n=1 Tax=Pyrobaculum ferrireducens TaxID=1104324 RepID=G7VIE7_9CREN|nr:hypothetical protein [Pyrobaculum ferrireducens]AET33427.1 hypothetical protein P186_2031 [Pyrobaculum ferrireducens]
MRPRIAVIVPICDGAVPTDLMLANIAEQVYPGEVEVIVADSASSDCTAEGAER